MTGKLEEMIRNALDEEPMAELVSKDLAVYEWELFDDGYELPLDELAKLTTVQDPRTELEAMIADLTDQCSEPILDELLEKLKAQYPMSEDEEYEAVEWLRGHVFFLYPEEAIYQQRVKANLIFATENEENRDFDCYSNFDKDWWLPSDCMVSKLIKLSRRQSEFRRAAETGQKRLESGREIKLPVSRDVLVESTIEELLGLNAIMGAFTVLLDVSLEEFIQLLELTDNVKTGFINLLPGTTCGIFNPWNGSGSEMNIRFERAVSIPSSYLWSVWPDGTSVHGYDPGEVYGFTSRVWDRTGMIKLD